MNYGYSSYYTVRGQAFANKTLALLYANENKIPVSEVEWHFHDAEFNSVDWTIEPILSINELYAIRAKQLREKYDYLIVMCSGGPDSNNVVYSFLKNGIHIDEIIASAPLSGLSNWVDDPTNKKTENVISETRLAQIPFLAEVEANYPQVKITINDYFEDILEYKDTDWLIRSTDYVHPTTVGRYNIEKFSHLRKLAETEKKVGVIYGIDKPYLMFSNGEIRNVIGDYAVNVPVELEHFENFHTELFYFSHTLPELVVKQCHILVRWLLLPENKIALRLAALNGHPAPNKDFNLGLYQRAIVPCIYPMIEKQIWQAGKPKFNIFADMDSWFYQQHSSLKVYDMMKSNVNTVLNVLQPEYFQYKEYYNESGQLQKYKFGLKGFGKSFLIGKLHEFKNKSN